MLQGEYSAILLNFIKLPFVIKIFVLSIFVWPFYTGFTVYVCDNFDDIKEEKWTSLLVVYDCPHTWLALWFIILPMHQYWCWG